MPGEAKSLCVDDLRHAEYYGMQPVFDELYRKSKSGEIFTNLMEIILRRENILLAYRNIKTNGGSYTAGTDNRNITDIGSRTPKEVVEKVRFIVTGSRHGYRPKPVRRKDIPKPNGKTRPLGIPCIWDRLIQQCIKQVMEPICEAQFSDNSYGFRPNRSVEHAIARTYSLMQVTHLHYVIEFDIKGFFDNVNHSKLIKQIWAMGIRDKQLIFVIKRILTAPIRMPDGTTILPDKGTPQGGIISPLLANIMLNELDKEMEKRGLNFVRYADDCIIMVGSGMSANRVMRNISRFIEEKLGLRVNMTKSKVDRPSGLKYLGFGFYFDSRAHQFKAKPHAKSVAKFKKRMKGLTCRSWGVSNSYKVEKLNQLIRGWINYFKIGSMKILCAKLDANIRYRLRMCIWKHWKTPQNRAKNLMKLGIDRITAYKVGYCSRAYAHVCSCGAVNIAITNKRLASFGLISMLDYYTERCVTC